MLFRRSTTEVRCRCGFSRTTVVCVSSLQAVLLGLIGAEILSPVAGPIATPVRVVCSVLLALAFLLAGEGWRTRKDHQLDTCPECGWTGADDTNASELKEEPPFGHGLPSLHVDTRPLLPPLETLPASVAYVVALVLLRWRL